jgi:hsp70-interacting protein
MDGGGPDWKGLLKWSIAHSDGTQAPRQLSEEDKRFFAEAMESQTVDIIKRMKEISMVMNMPSEVLESQGVTVEELEELLEELQEHVESIDMANDLHAIGGLVPLLNYLKNPNAGIRSRAAEVVSTIVQNNPKSQQQVMECNGLEKLLANFNSDDNTKVRTKALGAISSLIRNNKVATDAFRLSNGYAGLREALASDDTRFQRKALQVMQYLLKENPKDHNVATQLGFVRSLTNLVNSPDHDMRQAALQSLVEIIRNQDNQSSGKYDDTTQLKDVISKRVEDIKKMNKEDLAAVKEERILVDLLWQFLYKEPSELRKEGLLVTPEDNAPPPDVASRTFASGLRALAESSPVEPSSGQNESQEVNKQKVLLLGP